MKRSAAPATGRHSLLFLVPTLEGGGAERVILTILRHLDRSRFDLTLAVLDGSKPVYLPELPKDVEYIDLKSRRVRYSVPAILRLVWKRRPHVVFSVIGHLNLAVALLRPLLPKSLRLVARETAVVADTWAGGALGVFWSAAYRRLYPRFDQVICQSEAMRRELVMEYGLPAHKACVIHNPVDVERAAHLAEEPLPSETAAHWTGGSAPIRLVAAGRLSVEKGFDLLIEAIALRADPRLRLTILGDGPLHGALVSLARERRVADQVQFVGFQTNPFRFYARADALVMSSRFEAFPNVVLEALACGTPVIATPAPGGIFEILSAQPGSVIAGDVSAESLARAIANYPFNQLRPAISLAAYSPARICQQYAEVFLASAKVAA